jgi:hypothetical protein
MRVAGGRDTRCSDGSEGARILKEDSQGAVRVAWGGASGGVVVSSLYVGELVASFDTRPRGLSETEDSEWLVALIPLNCQLIS